jgi:hypothetical protein
MGIKDRPEMAKNIGKPGVRPPQFIGAPKPIGSRNRLQGKFLHALADSFDKHGKAAIDYCVRNDPIAYVKICASLMPKEFKQLSPLEELSEAELVAAIEYVKGAIVGESATRVIEAPVKESIN